MESRKIYSTNRDDITYCVSQDGVRYILLETHGNEAIVVWESYTEGYLSLDTYKTRTLEEFHIIEKVVDTTTAQLFRMSTPATAICRINGEIQLVSESTTEELLEAEIVTSIINKVPVWEQVLGMEINNV